MDDADSGPLHAVVIWTYFIQAGVDGPVKIGIAEDVEERLKQLQTGCPDDLRLIGRIHGNCESDLHGRFERLRLRGEWFKPDVRLMAFIVEHAESCGHVEALVLAAKNVIRAFDGMADEVREMWFSVATARGHGGPCPWPHVKAFDDGIDTLRKRVAALSR
jgi:hypothetical protein